MLKTIKLYGVLGEKFGREFKLDVASPREAIRALSVLVQGFEKFMLHAHEHGLTFALITNKKTKGRGKKVAQVYDNVSKRTIKGVCIGQSELDMHSKSNEIHIVPRVIGAGGNNGVLQVVLGVIMVAVGYFTFGATSAYGVALIGAGLGMAVGGVAQMLMPKVANAENQNQDGNKANNGFGSAVTTLPQGNPYPMLIGERLVGCVVLSAAQYPEDQM